MASTIDDFRSKVNKQGLAKSNKYYVEFRAPFSNNITVPESNGQLPSLSLYCSSVNVAGRNLNDAIVREYGINRKIVYGQTYADLQTTFYCSEDMREKAFFDKWMNKVIPTPGQGGAMGAYDVEYYDSYIGDVYVTIADDNLDNQYKIHYFECYPKTVNPLEMAYGTNNAILSLTVQWNYLFWEEKGNIAGGGYDPTHRYTGQTTDASARLTGDAELDADWAKKYG